MKTIRIRRPRSYYDYPEDVQRIVRALASHGYRATEDQADELWRMHSDAVAAGWLYLPATDEEIVADVRPYFDEVEDESEQ